MTEFLLAHGGALGGPNFEALVLAVPMVVVGVILFVQRSVKPIVSVVMVLGGITLIVGGFTFLSAEDDHDAQAAPSAEAGYTGVVEGLCEAREQLQGERPEDALSSFYDRSHVALHEIAARLSDEDKAAAARLLEAKQSVESGNTNVVVLRALDELIIATIQGLAELDQQVQGCA